MEVISSPVPPDVGIWAGVLDRDLDADAGPDVALVRQCGQPQRLRPVQRWQGMVAGGGDENGSSRAPRARSAPGSQCDRSGPARCRRRPCAYPSTTGGCRPGCGLRPGQCAPGCRPGRRTARLCAGACSQDVGDIGRPLGDDLQGLMQVPVGGGLQTPESRATARTSVPSLSHRSTTTAWTQVVAAR